MKYFSIPKPCSENWNEMTANEKGAFCQKCSNDVYDVSSMSNDAIIQLISSEKKVPCMRMTPNQEKSLNVDLGMRFQSQKRNMQRAMLFSLLVVFGFTLFSCNDSQQIHERNVLVSAAESITQTLDTVPNIEEKTYDLRKDIVTKTPVEPETAPEPDCIIDPYEQHLLGEPEIYQEPDIEDSVIEVIGVKKTHQIQHTMGIPAMPLSKEIPEVHLSYTQEQAERLSVSSVPQEFKALTFPNPATTSTVLKVDLPTDTQLLRIRLLDLNGRVLQNIHESHASAGEEEFQIDLAGLKPAYYLIDIQYNDQHEVVRLSKAH